MACTSPMTLYKSRSGPNRETGRWPLVPYDQGYSDLPVKVACGHCPSCYVERSKQWATRAEKELQMHTYSMFLTLTYKDEELIYQDGSTRATLHPDDLQRFWKRYRQYLKRNGHDGGIRYFACGEYGDKYGRPHYHAIVFGHDFKDKTWVGNKEGNDYYHSHSLNSLWTHGDCIIGTATFESCAYVARYVMKKRFGQEAQYYEREQIQPEFIRMSRRPGIAADWFDKYQSDVFPNDYVVIKGGKKVNPPKYFTERYAKKCQSLLDTKNHPMEFNDLKNQRLEKMAKFWKEKLPERLRVKAKILQKKLEGLKRPVE